MNGVEGLFNGSKWFGAVPYFVFFKDIFKVRPQKTHH